MEWKYLIEKILPPAISPEPKDKSQIMNRLNYVGGEQPSKTQLKKLRREAAEKFIDQASKRPNWQNRIDELWTENGDKRFKLD